MTKRSALIILLSFVGFGSMHATADEREVWRDTARGELPFGPPVMEVIPISFRTVVLDSQALEERLLPLEQDARQAAILVLPLSTGENALFEIHQSRVMEPELAARYPSIRTFSGIGLDDPSATAHITWTEHGFNAIILATGVTTYVLPHTPGVRTVHIAYDTRDLPATPWTCNTEHADGAKNLTDLSKAAPYTSGARLRLYRMAIAVEGEWTQAYGGGTVPGALAVVVERVNSLNAIYERDFAIRLVLVADEDQLIYTDPNTDPFTPGASELTVIQDTINSIIGQDAYDIGHGFKSTYGGGLASVARVCVASAKGRAVSGGVITMRILAHEVGHQFSANHTMNSTLCSSGGVGVEPGSGSTLMSYGGSCGADNIVSWPTYEFHSYSFDQVVAYVTEGNGGCGVEFDFGNTAPAVNAGSTAFTLPKSTPFELTGSATDSEGDPLSYGWIGMDLGTPTTLPSGAAPFFRSFPRVTSSTRTFPQIGDVISGVATLGEELPTTAQALNFRLEAVDNYSSSGGVAYDDMALDIDGTAGPFQVTYPNGSETLLFAATPTVAWNVAGTTASPVLCSLVNIDLSLDGGYTYPLSLASGTANDGTESVTLPSSPTSSARVRVRCASQRNTANTADVTDHFFFDISDGDFTIQPDTSGCVTSLVVSSLANNGACTLRDSIAAAIAGSVITFHASISGGGINLTSGEILINKNLTIDGGSQNITVNGSGLSRVFFFDGPLTATVNDLTITNGRGTVNSFGEYGAGIRSENSTLALNRCTISDNNHDYFGGGLFQWFGTVTINDCTFSGNRGGGGGIYKQQGTLIINRSTFSGNVCAGGSGGALRHTTSETVTISNSTFSGNSCGWSGGGIFSTQSMTVNNSTFSDNSAGTGAAIWNSGTLSLTNNILANSTAGGDCFNDGAGTISVNTANLIEDTSCSPAYSGDPNLGPLAGNGGYTDTFALLGQPSNAIDNGDATVCTAVGGVDQRSYTRPGGVGCDIGAYELNGGAPGGAPSINPGQVFSVNEMAPIGTVVDTVITTGGTAPLSFSIGGGNTDNAFAINSATGQITVARWQPLDVALNSQFLLNVVVIDSGVPNLADSAVVTVNINDVNFPPVVLDDSTTLLQTAANGSSVLSVAASDPDLGDSLSYSITGGNTGDAFSINPNSGEIRVADNSTFGTSPSFSLTVTVSDGLLSDTGTIGVSVGCSAPGQQLVVSIADSGACTLRQAVLDASEGDTVTFDNGIHLSTIVLTSGAIVITKSLTIDGDGADMSVSGNNSSRIFYIRDDSGTRNVVIEGLTLREGNSAAAAVDAGSGGAVYNYGETVTIRRCVVRNNSGNTFGAISQSGGEYSIEDSTFFSNVSFLGGALVVNGTTTISGSVFYENSTTGSGGGAIASFATLTMNNCTVSGNSAAAATGGGGVWVLGGTTNLNNSTVAGNSADGTSSRNLLNQATLSLRNSIIADGIGSGTADCGNSGTIEHNLNSIIEGGAGGPCDSGTLTYAGFQSGDPNVGPLQSNGGLTDTHALLVGSTAIGGGDASVCASADINGIDQRSFGRDGSCDIGAYEFGASPQGSSVWDGGGSTNNWSEAANWVGDAVPAASADVVFNGTSTKPSVVDSGFGGAVNSLTLVAGVGGHVTLEKTLALTVDLDLGAGTVLDMSTFVATVEGTVTQQGVLRQTKAATVVSTPVDIAMIKNAAGSTTKFYGVQITPTASSLGNVVAEVRGQASCGGNPSDPLVKRCYAVGPDNDVAATLRLYYTESERNGMLANQLNLWHFDAGTGTWATAGAGSNRSEADLICLSDDGSSCWAEATAISSFSRFALGNQAPPTPLCSVEFNLTAGEWNLVANPCLPAGSSLINELFASADDDLTPSGLWSTWGVHDWNEGSDAYDQATSNTVIERGQGYWLASSVSATMRLVGDWPPAVPHDEVLVSHPTGRYNMVGHAFVDDLDWADVRVVDGGTELTLNQADPVVGLELACDSADPIGNGCVMSRKMNQWNGSAYQVFDGSTPGAEGVLSKGQGMWVKAFAPSTLRSPVPTGGSRQTDAEGWWLRLIATSGALEDPGNMLGQLTTAIDGQDYHDLDEPEPFGSNYLSVVFLHPEWPGSLDVWGFTTDYRAISADSTWDMEIRSNDGSRVVVMTWDGPEAVLAQSRLIDLDGGGQIIEPELGGRFTIQLLSQNHRIQWIYGGSLFSDDFESGDTNEWSGGVQ